MLDVIIIGAGQAGLSLGYYLQQSDISFAMFEKDKRLGDSWRKRYDSLVLFTPKSYSFLPGMSFEGDRNEFPTKDEMADYLESYAQQFSLPVKLDTNIHNVKKVQDIFEVHTNNGTYFSKNVVIASGAFQIPFIPSLSKGCSSAIFQIHSSQYKSPSQIPDGPVLVVGGGNSGAQIAVELAAVRDVTIAVSHPFKFLPLRVLGKSIFYWFEKMGLLYAGTDTKRGSWIQKQADPIFGFELKRLIRNGKIEVKSRVTDVQKEDIWFQDGSKMKVRNIVWSTGFTPDYAWIEIEGALDENGSPLHYRGISPIQNLFFIGLPWQHQRGSALVCGVGRDAEYLLPFIKGSLRIRDVGDFGDEHIIS